jgi:ubiquinone/menaquinone biosynthesis C-methylase UbiE
LKSQDETEKAIGYYDDFSLTYDDERRAGYFGFINELEFGKIENLARGKTTLEIGCGTGLILEKTHRVAELAVGVDVSPGMVEVCGRKQLNAQVTDGHTLPFADNSFDLTYSFKVLPHIPEIRNILLEAARVTKPEGRMVLEFYNTYSLKFINDNLRSWRNGDPVYIRHDSLREFTAYVPDGWELQSVRGVRIFGPAAFCYTLPVVAWVFRTLDRLFCDLPVFRNLGSYCVAEFKQTSGT